MSDSVPHGKYIVFRFLTQNKSERSIFHRKIIARFLSDLADLSCGGKSSLVFAPFVDGEFRKVVHLDNPILDIKDTPFD
ncbi:hypothetical protein J14TS5_48800 [Paenibacillus lautus]|nr:hypothetical protein J14TS5_48800 [Paenibacillus lautus]